ncbi:MAG: bacteriohemerythrin [Planctomycetota bacterium]|jgi:hemerythrin|nr:bacteriohemerythrin [Planctomycetota bacterium]
MEWRDDLETGISVVDEQHKELFRQADILLDRNNAARVNDTLKFLEDYVVKHFGTEELMQNTTKYPRRDEHKKMHDDFIVTFGNLKQEFLNSGSDMLFIIKMTKIVVDWLNTHIGIHDKDFGVFFKTCWQLGQEERDA